MTCLVSWEVVRENILCAYELEGGDFLFILFLFFLRNPLVGQRYTGATAVSEWPCQPLWRSQQQQMMALQLAKVDLCMGKQGKVGGGNTRKKRKLLDKIVGMGLATAAEWAVANVPSQPKDLLQHCVSPLWAPRGALWVHRRLWFWQLCLCWLTFKSLSISSDCFIPFG